MAGTLGREAEPAADPASGASVPDFGWVTTLAAGVVGVLTIVRLFAMSGPEIAGRYMADDAFYYLELARNFPTPQFNSGISTTGFHPLWWVLLAPVEAVADGVTVLRVALAVAVLLHIATGFVLGRAFAAWWSPAVANIAAALWIVHPGIRSIALIGVESALVSLMLAVLLLVSTKPITHRNAVLGGVALGVCFLARTDSLLFAGPIVAVWLWRSSWLAAARAAGAAAVVALPWVTFLFVSGGLQQDSSSALIEVRHELGTFNPSAELRRFAAEFGDLAVSGWSSDLPGPQFLWLAIVAGLIVVYRPRPVEVAMTIGVVVVHFAQAAQLGAMREWYAVYLLFAVAVLAFPRVLALLESADAPTLRRAVPAALVVLVVGVGVVQRPSMFPQEHDKYVAAIHAQQIVDEDAKVAAFNTGIYQWVMPNDVVNLDGVVNPDVLPHLADRTVCDYVEELDVEWIIDSSNGEYKAHRLAPGMLGAVTELEINAVADEQFLWSVLPSC